MKKNSDVKFNVLFLKEAELFMDSLNAKVRAKILYNAWKASELEDKELFKKLHGNIWELRTIYNRICYRFFAFWDKSSGEKTLVVATHGIIKKSDKISKNEIDKAEKIRNIYFNKE